MRLFANCRHRRGRWKKQDKINTRKYNHKESKKVDFPHKFQELFLIKSNNQKIKTLFDFFYYFAIVAFFLEILHIFKNCYTVTHRHAALCKYIEVDCKI